MRMETPRLIIRNWNDSDRNLFHHINSDEQVMRFFPFRRSRAESDTFLDHVRAGNEARGWGFSALEEKATGQPLGFAGLSPADVPACPQGVVEIGWRLSQRHWGKGYATEAAQEWLRFGFEMLDLAEIVSFAVWNNEPSIAVMRRIGMVAEPESDFDHPRVPDSHPHLKRHVLYRLTRDRWAATRQKAEGRP